MFRKTSKPKFLISDSLTSFGQAWMTSKITALHNMWEYFANINSWPDLLFATHSILRKKNNKKKAASKPPKCKQTQFFCEMGDVQSWSCAGQPIFTSFFQFLTLWGHDFGVVREAEDDFWRPASIALVLKCHRSPTFVLQYLNLSQKIWFHKTTKLLHIFPQIMECSYLHL